MNILIVKRQQDLIKYFIKKSQLDCEIVELGCGDGMWNKDISGFTALRGDLFNLDIAGKDAIPLLLTLEHLQDDVFALEKINSYLRKEG